MDCYQAVSFSMEFSANALPLAGTTGQVYHGGIQYKKVLFDLFGWRPTIVSTLTDRTYNNPVALSFDYYPGGNYQLPFDFQNTALNNDFINASITAFLAPSFNFIPTPSAIDIGGGATPLNNSDYLRKYTSATPPIAPKNSPFVNFTTSFPNNANINETHISFNTRNGNWLALELDNSSTNNDNFDCTFICADNQISGSNVLCTTGNYSVPAGTTFYNWNITSGSTLVTMTGNGTPNITLTVVPNESGQVTISATYGDNFTKCGNVTITKTIFIGVPQFSAFDYTNVPNLSVCIAPIDPITISLPSQNVRAIFLGMTNAEIMNNANWEWERTNNLIFITGMRDVRSICPLFDGTSNVRVRARNSCGWSEWFEVGEFTITTQQPNQMRVQNSLYTVYPNPSNDIVQIGLKNESQKPVLTAKITGELFDLNGQKRTDVKIENNKALFSVRGLQKGIYVVKIKIDDTTEDYQIAVQ